MLSKKLILIILVCTSILILASCGTFEVGIENNPPPVIPTDTEGESPVPSPTLLPTEPTAEPELSVEQAIKIALGEKLGLPIEDMPFSISEINDQHAKGDIDNGYFLAAKRDGEWVIVYDGQATPPCTDVEQYQFSADMVPECLGDANQLVKRSGSTGGDIEDALADFLGKPADELKFTLRQDTGAHILGYLPGGYFLAAKVDGDWQIVFAGNGTPYCAMVDLHDFPAYIVPECVDRDNNLVYRTDSADELPSLQSLDCGPDSPGANFGTVDYTACNIQDALRSRNISALLGYLADPFTIGYWRSEGVQYSPNDFLEMLPDLYNFNDPDYIPRLLFTTDRGQFPDLDGMQPEAVFGPEVNVIQVVYSQGWGQDGQGGSLLYLTQDESGDYIWYGMLYSGNDFAQ